MELADPTVWMVRWGLLALFALTLLENLNLPLPSEPVLLFAGYQASVGNAHVVAVVLVALAGSLVGALGSYGIGHSGRRLLDRHGRWVGATPKRVEASDRWMQRHGEHAVLYGRVVPLVRTFVSVAAGIARMPLGRFTALTALGAGAWITLLVSVGYVLGDTWHDAERIIGPVTIALLGALAVGAVTLIVLRRRGRAIPD